MDLKNIRSLDGVRALAISLVLYCHYFSDIVNPKMWGGLMKYIKYTTFWTWSGVDLFFILSGFLIGRILITNKASKNYFKSFYLRRVFRIFPAYYLVLLIYLILLLPGLAGKFPYLTQGAYPFYSYMLYIQNFWMAVHNNFGASLLGLTWSLSVEEQFYLILPLIILLINHKNLPKFLLVSIILAPICRAVIPGLGSYVLLPARMDSLLFGVLIAYYHLNGTLEAKLVPKRKVLPLLLPFFFLLLILVCVMGEQLGDVFIHSVLALLYGTVLILALVSDTKSRLVRVLSMPVLSFMARISYMVYLTHQLFSGLLHQLILNQSPQINNLNDALVTLSALAFTIAFSAFSYYYFESPVLKLGKKYKY